jgi:hypothetical protein
MESEISLLRCPRCQSEYFKKNGFTHNGKQSYRCRCGRQFVAGGAAWYVSDEDKVLIDKLLLERISLNGICRVANVSQKWLLGYLKELYRNLPDHLNAELDFGDEQAWLDDRMDEEIERLEVVKKIRHHWSATAIPAKFRRSKRL